MKSKRLALFASIVFLLSGCSAQVENTSEQKLLDIKNCNYHTSEIVKDTLPEEVYFDPYALENRYDLPARMFERSKRVDYGTVLNDVEYWSSTADDYKQCNILLPPDYDETKTYPVLYVIHGWGGNHANQIDTNGYLTLLYGNMMHDGLTVPMIIVNVDMYTDKLAEKGSKTNLEMRYIYDKVVDDIAIDLMPFIEKNYPVKKGREYTAVAGVSQGASEALCTGFKWLDKFGFISGYAPDAGVIPTKWFEGTFWNIPYFEEFPTPAEDSVPYYVYMAVGSNDPENVEITLYYSDVLKELGVHNQTDLVEGYGHNPEFWEQCFFNYLSKIFRTDGSCVPPEPKDDPILSSPPGDINGDYDTDIVDVAIVISHINGQKALTEEEMLMADVDHSNEVDIVDAVMLLSHINGENLLK